MIRHTTAQRIASQWHDGGGSALYALASTGAIDTARADHDAADEIAYCRPSASKQDTADLDALLAYVQHYGPRGPVTDWYARTIAKGA